jgi:DinB superfamily
VNAPVPYSDLLSARDPLAVLAETPRRIEEMVRGWDGPRWGVSYAAGKWSAAQLMLHLAHDEIGWGNRVRLAVTQDRYVAHPYDGGAWVEVESPSSPDVAPAAFAALRRLNVALYGRLTPSQKDRPISHPEYGQITVEWIIRVLAGHDLHHLQQLNAIAAR